MLQCLYLPASLCNNVPQHTGLSSALSSIRIRIPRHIYHHAPGLGTIVGIGEDTEMIGTHTSVLDKATSRVMRTPVSPLFSPLTAHQLATSVSVPPASHRLLVHVPKWLSSYSHQKIYLILISSCCLLNPPESVLDDVGFSKRQRGSR